MLATVQIFKNKLKFYEYYLAEREKMAENENVAAAKPPVLDENAPQVGVVSQYTKDLSFENPNAPHIFKVVSENKPNIDVNIGVATSKLGEETYEVELKVNVLAKNGEETTFVLELIYAGVFGLKNIPDETIQPFLLIQAPTLLFPYARRVISDASRDGGFPPLLLEPVDFAGLYQHTLDQAKKEVAEKGETTS
jgi:preprotein translocase subunit SecB